MSLALPNSFVCAACFKGLFYFCHVHILSPCLFAFTARLRLRAFLFFLQSGWFNRYVRHCQPKSKRQDPKKKNLSQLFFLHLRPPHKKASNIYFNPTLSAAWRNCSCWACTCKSLCMSVKLLSSSLIFASTICRSSE